MILMFAPLHSYAQTSPNSAGPAASCDPGIIKACAATAEELKQARLLIQAQADEIVALDHRVATEKEKAQLHREKNDLLSQQLDALDQKIQALESANQTLSQLKARLDERVAKLEKQKSAANKRTLIFAAAGVVIGFLASR